MKQFVYLTVTPEALIASHLAPEAFGHYLAVGTKKRIRGQAIFFEIDMEKMETLPFEYINERLVPYDNGEPKRSVYLSIYRVMEQVPIEALKSLFLVTDDGKVLELIAGRYTPKSEELIHLYQQFNPIETRVASKLSPPDFIQFLTDQSKPVFTPKLFIVELKLNKLSFDPDAPMHNLPYPNPDHLKECLNTLRAAEDRMTKTVIRQFKGDLSYRTIQDGFFIGEGKQYKYYPFPRVEELEASHYNWWRSALVQCF